jgi:hypothetical protein
MDYGVGSFPVIRYMVSVETAELSRAVTWNLRGNDGFELSNNATDGNCSFIRQSFPHYRVYIRT